MKSYVPVARCNTSSGNINDQPIAQGKLHKSCGEMRELLTVRDANQSPDDIS